MFFKAMIAKWLNAADLRSAPPGSQVQTLLIASDLKMSLNFLFVALLAQLVEHGTFNLRVTGSNPV